MRLIQTSAVAVLVVAGLALVGGAGWATGATEAAPPGRSVTATGSGVATAVPNRASFGFGVTTQARTASAALNGNSAEMAKVIAALKRSGVAARDIQTSSVSLSPRYSGDGDDIVGYTASNTVNATIRSVTKAGAVIDAAVGAGANQVYGPAFTRSDEAALYRRALRAAFADAKAKAATLAAAARGRLGAVRTITESSVGPVPVAEKDAAVGGVPIEPGRQAVQASVTVAFALR